MIAVGVGCRRACAPEEIAALVRAALQAHGAQADVLATGWMKAGAENIAQAAALLALPLVTVSPERLAAAAGLALTHSEPVAALHGVPSVAETAALAAAGDGARLLGARTVSASAACAVAWGEGA